MKPTDPVLIVGAGLSGLTCATVLHQNGVAYRIFEKADAVGGRIRTDDVHGFRLDRGFQVLLTAYPEAKRFLDYDKLDLHPFRAGALVHRAGSFHRLSDPFRHPSELIPTLRARVGSLADKLAVLKLRRDVRPGATAESGHHLSGESTLSALRSSWGFSEDMIDGFFRPFIGGITLDPSLSTDRAFFEFVMHMFTEGDAAFPAGGMDAIPKQLAQGLNRDWIHLNTGVTSIIDPQTLLLSDGSRVHGSRVVVATDMTGGQQLDNTIEERAWNGTTCMYFDAPKAPLESPVLVLNGEAVGCINNVVVPSLVAPGYAPKDHHLVAVSLFARDDKTAPAPEDVMEELQAWFGPEVRDWTHLRTYHIPHSLPSQETNARTLHTLSARLEDDGHIVCGDHMTTSSINGAMASGRVAAEMILAASSAS